MWRPKISPGNFLLAILIVLGIELGCLIFIIYLLSVFLILASLLVTLLPGIFSLLKSLLCVLKLVSSTICLEPNTQKAIPSIEGTNLIFGADLIGVLVSVFSLMLTLLAIFVLTITFLAIYNELSDKSEINQAQDIESLGPVLANKLNRYFDKPELEALCFELHIDYENLRGDTKIRKCQELIGYCQRRGRILELIEHTRLNRPHVSWL